MSRPITIQFYRPRSRAARIRAQVLRALGLLAGGLAALFFLAGILLFFYALEVSMEKPRATRSTVLEVEEIDGARVVSVSHVDAQMEVDETTVVTSSVPKLELALEEDVRGVEHAFTAKKRVQA